MADREEILAALDLPARHAQPMSFDSEQHAAVGDHAPVEGNAPAAEPLPDAAERVAAVSDIEGLWARFTEMLEALGGRLGTVDELKSLDGQVWIDEDARPYAPHLTSSQGSIWDVRIGITTADVAVAETGTLFLSAAPGRARLASLAPPVHAVLIEQSKIVSTLEEAMAFVGDRTSVFVTGPSRTADIEGILIRGVHGPGELIVIPIS